MTDWIDPFLHAGWAQRGSSVDTTPPHRQDTTWMAPAVTMHQQLRSEWDRLRATYGDRWYPLDGPATIPYRVARDLGYLDHHVHQHVRCLSCHTRFSLIYDDVEPDQLCPDCQSPLSEPQTVERLPVLQGDGLDASMRLRGDLTPRVVMALPHLASTHDAACPFGIWQTGQTYETGAQTPRWLHPVDARQWSIHRVIDPVKDIYRDPDRQYPPYTDWKQQAQAWVRPWFDSKRLRFDPRTPPFTEYDPFYAVKSTHVLYDFPEAGWIRIGWMAFRDDPSRLADGYVFQGASRPPDLMETTWRLDRLTWALLADGQRRTEEKGRIRLPWTLTPHHVILCPMVADDPLIEAAHTMRDRLQSERPDWRIGVDANGDLDDRLRRYRWRGVRGAGVVDYQTLEDDCVSAPSKEARLNLESLIRSVDTPRK